MNTRTGDCGMNMSTRVIASVAIASSFVIGAEDRLAMANGRAPATSTIHFRQGNDLDVIVGLTFGATVSHDGGATWQWMCEDTVGYGGQYDPDYSYSASGTIFGTTFDGLKANRTGCTFDVTPPAATFVSQNTIGPDGAVYYAAADPADAKIYRSADDGMSFPRSSNPGQLNDWWQSLEVAPSDANRVYLSGYRLQSGLPRQLMLFASSDGAQVFSPLPITDFTVEPESFLEIAGISKANADLVFARIVAEDTMATDAIYRSTNGGQTWTRVLAKPTSLSFVVRGNGDLVAASPSVGAWVSHDNGASWIDLVGAPHISCLVENAGGVLWACTRNFGTAQVPGDDAGVMRTTDLSVWTKALRYQDINAPVPCAAGTIQHDTCQVQMWCVLRRQLGVTSTELDCPSLTDGAGPDDAGGVVTPKNGCCDAGTGGGALALVSAVLVGLVILRPRSRRDT